MPEETDDIFTIVRRRVAVEAEVFGLHAAMVAAARNAAEVRLMSNCGSAFPQDECMKQVGGVHAGHLKC
jgi:hypothetical protein